MMRKILAVLLIAVLTTQSTSAATIYLRNKTRIEGAKIVEETAGEFHIRKAGENYSIVYSYDTVKKEDVFCIVDDAGALKYPPSLLAAATGPVDSLTARQFQEALLRQQLEALNAQNSNLREIGTIAIISTLVAISTSAAIWCLYGQTK